MDGKEYMWVRYPNGDGYLTYPGEPQGLKGPASSIRLEAAREGIEDYEYFFILQERMKEAARSGRNIQKAEQALERAKDLVSIPNAGGLRSTEILPDPDAVYRVREEIAEAIKDLRRG
jgi:hypothetical protein